MYPVTGNLTACNAAAPNAPLSLYMNYAGGLVVEYRRAMGVFVANPAY